MGTSSVESTRLALEALTMQIATQDSGLSAGTKKGLVTIGCLLVIHSDAAVREQAQELLNASITVESFGFVRTFFTRHRYELGNRVVQETSLALGEQLPETLSYRCASDEDCSCSNVAVEASFVEMHGALR